MRFSVFATLALLPVAALAGDHSRSPFRSRHRSVAQKRTSSFNLVEKHQGKTFFDGFDFFTDSDPTHGMVEFVSADEATSAGLAYVQDDNTTVMAVDDTTQLSPGQNRKSVRVTSKNTYNNGLFILDLYAMPHGCSVWPAYWTVGANWPNQGEIDIIEGVHENTQNQFTLHTGDGCSLDTNVPAVKNFKTAFSGSVSNTACQSSGSDNSGCAIIDSSKASYGHNLNLGAGGVFATQWDSTGIKHFFFPRGQIPDDIEAGNPDPSGWGLPAAVFGSGTCDIESHFVEHSIVFDITLCGDWAGATYQSAGCPGTCAQAVADPSNFSLAKWKINYLAVYQ